jgi:hypothetical protein
MLRPSETICAARAEGTIAERIRAGLDADIFRLL